MVIDNNNSKINYFLPGLCQKADMGNDSKDKSAAREGI